MDSRTTLRDLRRVVLLAGRVGRNEFGDSVGRSVLELPVGPGERLLDVWAKRLGEFAAFAGQSRVQVQIAVDLDGHVPVLSGATASPAVEFEIVRDPSEYRGTAGVVKDISRDWADADRVVVAAANQIAREPLADLLSGIGEETGVSLVPHGASDVASFFVLRREMLRDVPDVGFVDLKEQALRGGGGAGALRVARRRRGASFPVRTLAEYVAALRAIHSPADGTREREAEDDPFAETWQPRFAIIEPGAHVATDAVVQDSVILSGGVVGAGAVVARSVVCPGGVVARGRAVVEEIVRG